MMSDVHSADPGSDAVDEPDEVITEPHESPSDEHRRSRDWILPASLLGGLVLLIAMFGGGFLVGRATGGSDTAVAGDYPMHRLREHVAEGRGFGLGGFDERGPRGVFRAPRPEWSEDLEELPRRGLERLCGLLDEGALPEGAPMLDRLAELCSDDGG